MPKLRIYPRLFRKLVHWFLPYCKKVRVEYAEARRVIAPVIDKRREMREAARKSGQPIPQFNDALDRADLEAEAKGATCDPATFQLTLSVAAIHTSTDLLVQAVLEIAQHPEIFQSLREEIAQVLRVEGWKKTSLYNMKLLDSVIKESQRKKPIGIGRYPISCAFAETTRLIFLFIIASMRRVVEQDVKLSTGLVLKKGTGVIVDSYRMWDPNVHENPDEWDGYRFLKLRSQPGKENKAQLVSTSADHIAFGHGEHACPGRFFAANELKVALCHLLMKYDWKLVPGTELTPVFRGASVDASSKAKILIRRRKIMELDIDSI